MESLSCQLAIDFFILTTARHHSSRWFPLHVPITSEVLLVNDIAKTDFKTSGPATVIADFGVIHEGLGGWIKQVVSVFSCWFVVKRSRVSEAMNVLNTEAGHPCFIVNRDFKSKYVTFFISLANVNI